ncbi:glycosyltransferase family 61 protein [Paracoccus sp. PAR01]|uniref:glycosyltransferase family 61 protein n=1 Tax=Paracoccus sp. PAR01 TaxID=2769282 RepID=UPI00177C001D|nr:glycosyltransferase family 61 protein [Paracoccus sp. PAR01]MBD9526080.1 glycosyltransferase family 61 protein [Paracoccus sp. PAR01]
MPNPLRPYNARFRRLLGRPEPDFMAGAVESWTEAPSDIRRVRPALHLPGQLERVRASVFANLAETVSALTRDGEMREGATTGWRFRNVDLIDGVLYGDGAELHLRNRQRRYGLALRPQQAVSGALYETWTTNRWFGSWLMEGPAAWLLASRRHMAMTTAAQPKPGSHAARYEQIMGIAPQRIAGDVHFDELILFGDMSNNADKRRRQHQMREKLLAGRDPKPVPGVFLLRGTAGDLRLLRNERELAERLAAERGFLVIDPLAATADELIEACSAARAIVGVEGSQLVHGIIAAPQNAAILPIQPPDRVAATLKGLTDRLDQRFGLLVAEGNDTVFTLNWRDLAATLDLFD